MSPTVIPSSGNGGGVKPTAIPSGTPTPTKPSVIGGGSTPTPKPTAMPATTLPLAPQPLANVSAPTAMPGKTRKRLPVTREELQRKHRPKDSVLDRSIAIIQITDQDSITMNVAVRWGQELQEQHNTLAGEILNLAQSEVIQAVTENLNRMMEILGNINLQRVFEETSFVTRALRKASSEIDTPDELDSAMREIEQLKNLMRARTDELLALREKFEQNSKTTEDLGDEIEASIIAALELAEYIKNEPSRVEISTCLQERADGLTQTLAQIRAGGSMRKIHIDQPLKLTTLIQQVVFNTLPTWMGNASTMLLALQGKQKPNPTEISELGRTLKSIISNLK